MTFSRDNIIPHDHDVVLGLKQDCFNHPGNLFYRQLIQNNSEKFNNEILKSMKRQIALDIFDKVRGRILPGRFLNKKEDKYHIIDDKKAIEKIKQALRDRKKITVKRKVIPQCPSSLSIFGNMEWFSLSSSQTPISFYKFEKEEWFGIDENLETDASSACKTRMSYLVATKRRKFDENEIKESSLQDQNDIAEMRNMFQQLQNEQCIDISFVRIIDNGPSTKNISDLTMEDWKLSNQTLQSSKITCGNEASKSPLEMEGSMKTIERTCTPYVNELNQDDIDYLLEETNSSSMSIMKIVSPENSCNLISY